MPIIGIVHAIITAGTQVVETIVANGIGFEAFGHIINISGALMGWVADGLIALC
ncbi:hypothetical protein BCR36DRAFT_578971 [Piromyces finnis]|uniref:Uncharacterized protein n=1 Tax=Piromyces finnis TaxID=1754191 RepID=A0A1Y1VNA6_9FUNG|nr:hypothetical protein BCR36DRAFT_578971 [Piromyces finnis]|eukprot:ORX60898.1 hypothetical protein BCR36DRAFT_578971 [Piromyces finnis]